jgi:hypothetical protein
LSFTARDAQLAPQPRGHRDHLDVDVGAREAEGFHVDLRELPVAARLRALVAEHGARSPKLQPRAAQQAIGDGGARDARRGLGPQREAFTVGLGEVNTPLDDVGELAVGAKSVVCSTIGTRSSS